MAWTIEYTDPAVKALRKLDRAQARRITAYIRELTGLDDPHQRGKGLTGPLAGLWRYRVGDYRIICDLNADRLAIIALTIEHRSQAYR
uniref:Type II toxin-antitoxin system RelE/ParE family toxin n=1 Tax=Acidipropionibacterium jensenii TaxID=1749 RepID=Q93S35_9ACTN|nr:MULTISPECIES: type II toxin-antitoxin system RelE/ParE family toxin [Acidipropionibacterium]AFK88682.1 hypothetical protein [Acidipropionibacterium jensenii]CAC38044.1 hypothetical protein [Acidipropionibacterium jensenii]